MGQSEQLADFAHLVLSVARDIRLAGHVDPEIIEVTELESLVMNEIMHNPGISPSDICSGFGLRSSNTSSVLRSLEAKGMIQRKPDPEDRRSVGITATELAAGNLDRVRDEWARILSAHIDESLDLAPAIELLGDLDASLSRIDVTAVSGTSR